MCKVSIQAYKLFDCTALLSEKVVVKFWSYILVYCFPVNTYKINKHMRVGTLIEATIYLQLIQNRYMFRSFTVLQCSHQHCVQPVASDVEVIGYL